MIINNFCSGKPGGLGSLTGAQSVSFRQGSNVEFGIPAHERMVCIIILMYYNITISVFYIFIIF